MHNPVSSTTDDHVESTPSTSENEVHGQKGKVKIPCGLCEGDHHLPHCPFLDEAKRVLCNRPASLQRLPSGYKKLTSSLLLVENPTDITQPSVETPIIESESFESIPDESQQVKMIVDPVLPSEYHTLPEESKNDTVKIIFVTSESEELGGNPPVPSQQEENPPVLVLKGLIHQFIQYPLQVV